MGKQTTSALWLCILLTLTGCIYEGVGTELTHFRQLSVTERAQKSARIQTQLALEYMRAQDTRQAVAAIETAVSKYPKYADAWLVRAQIYQFLKINNKAEESFQHALKLQPNGAEINNNYGWFLCSVANQPQQALAYFDRALSDPTYPSPETAYLNKATCHAKMAQYGLATGYIEKALAVAPKFTPAFKEMAKIKVATKQYTEALQWYARYEEQMPELSAADLLLAWQINQDNGNNQAAIKYAEQLKQRFPYSNEWNSINNTQF